jgi:tRNA(Ile)-lysidine synthase
VADEKFCEALAKKHKLKFFSRRFDVAKHGKENGSNIQLAARQLRYEWFHELLAENDFDYVLTAHHAGDLVETLLINLEILNHFGFAHWSELSNENEKKLFLINSENKIEIKQKTKHVFLNIELRPLIPPVSDYRSHLYYFLPKLYHTF